MDIVEFFLRRTIKRIKAERARKELEEAAAIAKAEEDGTYVPPAKEYVATPETLRKGLEFRISARNFNQNFTMTRLMAMLSFHSGWFLGIIVIAWTTHLWGLALSLIPAALGAIAVGEGITTRDETIVPTHDEDKNLKDLSAMTEDQLQQYFAFEAKSRSLSTTNELLRERRALRVSQRMIKYVFLAALAGEAIHLIIVVLVHWL